MLENSVGACALVIAHPGHELRVHAWMHRMRPLCMVLTDGSGTTGVSRLDSTTSLIEAAGCRAGALYGVADDADVYRRILAGDIAYFRNLLETLRADFLRSGIRLVCGDAVEGFNPSHDLCRGLIEAVVARIRLEHGIEIHNLAFALTGRPDSVPPDAETISLRLTDEEMQSKLRAASGYTELASEIEFALEHFGMEAFRQEVFWPCVKWTGYDALPEDPPYYEIHGLRRKKAGVYSEVICYQQHVKPLLQGLREWALEGKPHVQT